MRQRFYDPEGRYKHGVLKEYRHWILEVSYRQHTFGCFIIFCKRPGVEKISELLDDELLEFRQVCHEIETLLLQNPAFAPDRFNYWQMGNGLRQLHFHGIPRYATPRKLGKRVFQDKSFGTVPIWTRRHESDETVIAIRELLLSTPLPG